MSNLGIIKVTEGDFLNAKFIRFYLILNPKKNVK